MDDFGTGYSSLSYLQQLSLRQDQDRPVLRPRLRRRGESGAAIVRAIRRWAGLGMTTHRRRRGDRGAARPVPPEGCTDVQGYLISRPLAPELIDEFLRSRTESATAPVAA